jgi:hypothetical protein
MYRIKNTVTELLDNPKLVIRLDAPLYTSKHLSFSSF